VFSSTSSSLPILFYPQVSAYVREWALERWPQGGPVLLLEELSVLKEEIRQARAKEIAEGGVVEEP